MFIKYIIQGYFHWFVSKFKQLKNHKLYNQRMDICNSCENNINSICKICGCVLKAKTKSDSKCPIDNW